TYGIVPQIMDENGNTRFWHDDGKTGWVEVFVTINGLTHNEVLPIMDYKNTAIAADKITSSDANKTYKRCLTKALAMHGLGVYVYMGEDLPEETTKLNELYTKVANLVKSKCALSEKAKTKVGELCYAAEREANPDLEDSLISGNFKNIDDVEILENLEKKLLAVRK
ncbi:MAG: DUF1071 domain-containing protein, partial [Prevotella sp.]|nr:DUF1071 domain-containing protein [Prevotella sp.]